MTKQQTNMVEVSVIYVNSTVSINACQLEFVNVGFIHPWHGRHVALLLSVHKSV